MAQSHSQILEATPRSSFRAILFMTVKYFRHPNLKMQELSH
jgi:hypothetical protein